MNREQIKRLFVALVTVGGAFILIFHATLIRPWLGIGVFIWIITQWKIPLEPIEEFINR